MAVPVHLFLKDDGGAISVAVLMLQTVKEV